MKTITPLFLLFILSTCSYDKVTATEKNKERKITFTNCQEVTQMANIISNNNIFENTAESNLSLLSPLYQFGKAETNTAIDSITYTLKPVKNTWSEDTKLEYTNNTTDGSTVFQQITISIKSECFKNPKDLIELMQSKLGEATSNVDWDPEFGSESTWEYPSKDINFENVVVIQSTPSSHRISVENRPAPTEPF